MGDLLHVTRTQSREHAILADIYSDSMNSRLLEVADDHRRMFSKVIILLYFKLQKIDILIKFD